MTWLNFESCTSGCTDWLPALEWHITKIDSRIPRVCGSTDWLPALKSAIRFAWWFTLFRHIYSPTFLARYRLRTKPYASRFGTKTAVARRSSSSQSYQGARSHEVH